MAAVRSNQGGGPDVVDSLLILAPTVGLCFFFHVYLYVSSFAIILTERERELVASLCLPDFMWLFLTVPWVGLQCVIVVYSDQTHLLF